VAKKSNRMAVTHARQSTQAKKKRPQRPETPENANIAASQKVNVNKVATANQTTPPASAKKESKETQATSSAYAYVIPDLKRTGILAAAMFLMLIVLSRVL